METAQRAVSTLRRGHVETLRWCVWMYGDGPPGRLYVDPAPIGARPTVELAYKKVAVRRFTSESAGKFAEDTKRPGGAGPIGDLRQS